MLSAGRVIVAVASVALIAGVIAIMVGGTSLSSSGSVAAERPTVSTEAASTGGKPVDAAVPPDVRTAYPIFSGNPETVPAQVRNLIRGSQTDLAWGAAQAFGRLVGSSYWVLPASRQICLLELADQRSATVTCERTDTAVSSGLFIATIAPQIASDRGRRVRRVIGIVPAGVKAVAVHTGDVVSRVSARADGVFVMRDGLDQPPDHLSW